MINKRINITDNYSANRVINGGWQLSEGHALQDKIELQSVVKAFHTLVDKGFNTFDCADIYTGVEELLGQLVQERRSIVGKDDVQVHTKFVPDLSVLKDINYQYVERIIHRSLKRLNKEQVELVQFHWWDYDIPGCLDIAGYLVRIQEKGLIANLGTTNFDTEHLEQLIEAGYPLVSNQTQYSILDRRPQKQMVNFCLKNNIKLLCYGSLAGGFLSEMWLGLNEPKSSLENRSLVKYQLVIEDSFGWVGYQQLLQLLKAIGDVYGCSISNIAAAYMLYQDAVGSVIIGTRSERHITSNENIFTVNIPVDELQRIEDFINQYPVLSGEPFELERLEGGKHRNIMKMNLNDE